ncbi:MAG: hypothetical protein V3V10_05075 [Planctomycetota bacterium]
MAQEVDSPCFAYTHPTGDFRIPVHHPDMPADKKPYMLVAVSLLLLVVAIVVAVISSGVKDAFDWGTHIVTIPCVLLLGVVVGWMMRDKQAAEERAKAAVGSNDEDI